MNYFISIWSSLIMTILILHFQAVFLRSIGVSCHGITSNSGSKYIQHTTQSISSNFRHKNWEQKRLKQTLRNHSSKRLLQSVQENPSSWILSDPPSTTPSDIPSSTPSDVPSRISSDYPSSTLSDAPSNFLSDIPSSSEFVSDFPSTVSSSSSAPSSSDPSDPDFTIQCKPDSGPSSRNFQCADYLLSNTTNSLELCFLQIEENRMACEAILSDDKKNNNNRPANISVQNSYYYFTRYYYEEVAATSIPLTDIVEPRWIRRNLQIELRTYLNVSKEGSQGNNDDNFGDDSFNWYNGLIGNTCDYMSVNNMTCQSCTSCSKTMSLYDFTVDCSNIPGGRSLECTSIQDPTQFVPFTDSALLFEFQQPYDSNELIDPMSLLAYECC